MKTIHQYTVTYDGRTKKWYIGSEQADGVYDAETWEKLSVSGELLDFDWTQLKKLDDHIDLLNQEEEK